MYIGLDNEISISAPGIKSDNLTVRASNSCNVTKKANGKYTFTPSKGGRIDIIVSAKINDQNKIISRQTWKSTSLPKPYIYTPGVKYGFANSGSLATVLKEVGAKPKYSKSFPISSTPKIISAKMIYKDGNELRPLPDLINGKINKDTQDIIKRLRRGNSVEITMRAKGADNITHKIIQKISIR